MGQGLQVYKVNDSTGFQVHLEKQATLGRTSQQDAGRRADKPVGQVFTTCCLSRNSIHIFTLRPKPLNPKLPTSQGGDGNRPRSAARRLQTQPVDRFCGSLGLHGLGFRGSGLLVFCCCVF